MSSSIVRWRREDRRSTQRGLPCLGSRLSWCSAGSMMRGVWSTARSNSLRVDQGLWPMLCTCSATSQPIPTSFDAETGEAHYRQALALAEPRGMRPLVAHCHLGLGKLYQRIGKQEQAREHLTTATTMYREMDMRFWLEQAGAKAK